TEVAAVCAFIRGHFDIDWPNSLDAAARLRAREFGYRSVHYVVQLAPDKLRAGGGDVAVGPGLPGLKAEGQGRTIAQHCGADIGHDRLYKGTLKARLPQKWDRESGRAAALLEAVDDAFANLIEALRAYESHAGTYLSERELGERLELFE